MKQNCVAILFKVIMINDSTYAFVADKVIEGTYAEGFRLFIDNSGITYHDISKKHVCSDGYKQLFGFASPLEEIKIDFDTEGKEKALKKFFEVISETIYVGVVNNSINEFEMIPIPLEDIEDDIRNQNKKADGTIEEIAKKAYNLKLEDSLLKIIIEKELNDLKIQSSFQVQETFEPVKQYIIT